jgi:hypothetical protein
MTRAEGLGPLDRVLTTALLAGEPAVSLGGVDQAV